MYFESHAHMYFDDYDKDRDELLDSLFRSEISGIVNVGVDLKTSEECICLADKWKKAYAACGFHPNDLSGIELSDLKVLREFIKHEKVVAIGETGIDLYRERVSCERQRKFFIKHIEISLEEDFPLIIHSRSAEEETMSVIDEISDKYRGVFHCYAGSVETAHKLIEKGFYISFTGNITFKNTDRTEAVKEIPLDKMLLETDSPFLTPFPFRGKRNDPGKLKYIAEKIAEIKGVTIEEVAKATEKNTKELFRINREGK